MNWMSPVAPLTGLRMSGVNRSPVSNAIAAMRWLGSQPRPVLIAMTFVLNAGLTFLPHAISGMFPSYTHFGENRPRSREKYRIDNDKYKLITRRRARRQIRPSNHKRER